MLEVLAQAATQTATASGAGGGNPLLVWFAVLLGIAVVLLVMEMFIPSGGLLGLLAAAAAVGGVVCLFGVNTMAGLLATLMLLVSLPFVVGFLLKIWPSTPFARWIMLEDRQEARTGPTAAQQAKAADAVAVGSRGQALTDLRPVGTCLLNGRRAECLASGGVIERGSSVHVVAVRGMEIRVRRSPDG